MSQQTPPRIEFHKEAGEEYDNAFDWYLQRSPDVALGFNDAVNGALADIASAPRRWAAGSHSTRKYLLRRLPYVLIYRERAGHIQIVALAHTSRRPGYWKKRLKQ
jgi:toxin ParE1/3/4